jgi:hypothetical protein
MARLRWRLEDSGGAPSTASRSQGSAARSESQPSRRGRRTRALAALLGLHLLAPADARAEGSLGLDEVLQAVKANQRLVTEIDVALRRRDIKVREVICIAARHGNQWRHLSGGRVAPYQCEIGDQTLRIEAQVSYWDARGRRLGELGKAPERVLFERAVSFRQTEFRWTWKPR